MAALAAIFFEKFSVVFDFMRLFALKRNYECAVCGKIAQ